MKKLLFICLMCVACSTSTKKEGNHKLLDSLDMDVKKDSVATIVDKEFNDELRIYNGHFEWQPEGGAEGGGSLSLTYNENREFTFSLSTSLNECGANLEGTLFADRTQHAFYQADNCYLHFNFLMGDTVEIIEDNCEKHPKECGFAGDYVRVKG
jgi:hypothetical protein